MGPTLTTAVVICSAIVISMITTIVLFNIGILTMSESPPVSEKTQEEKCQEGWYGGSEHFSRECIYPKLLELEEKIDRLEKP